MVWGSPCSGKTTYAKSMIGENDLFYDYAEVMRAISQLPIHERNDNLHSIVLDIKSKIVEGAENTNVDKLILTICRPNQYFADEIAHLNPIYELLEKSEDTIIEQMMQDETRINKEDWRNKIVEWFEWYETFIENGGVESLTARKEGDHMQKRYFSMYADKEKGTADIYIYGDIVSWPWFDSDVDSYTLAKQIESLDQSVKTINVYINSYGGEVKEGLAIYNALKRHSARVRTMCDGMACSIASVIFMAGDVRAMNPASLLMIHNAWILASGDAAALRKQADDMDIINEAVKTAYLQSVNIGADELRRMMDAETWIAPDDAKTMGFATAIAQEEKAQEIAASGRSAFARLAVQSEANESNEIKAMLVEILSEVRQRTEPHNTTMTIEAKPFFNFIGGSKK